MTFFVYYDIVKVIKGSDSMNKKIIFVILLFIGISFIIYSFASPIEQEDNLLQNDDSISDKTGKSDNSDDDVFSKNNKKDNNKDDSDKNDKDQSDDLDENQNENEKDSKISTSNTSSQNTNVVKKPNGSYNWKPGSGSSNSSGGGTTSGSGTPSVDPSPIDPAPSNPTPSNPTPVDPIPVDPTPVVHYATFSFVPPALEPTDGTKNEIFMSQNGTKIVLSGTMIKQPSLPQVGGSYITLKIVSEGEYTKEQLANASIIYKYEYYEQTSKLDLSQNTINKNAYIDLTVPFVQGKTYSYVIDWGDGLTVQYDVTFNINVI